MAKAVKSGYGRSERVAVVFPGARCEKCRNLVCIPDVICGKGLELGSASRCASYDDISIDSAPMTGGVLGIVRQW